VSVKSLKAIIVALGVIILPSSLFAADQQPNQNKMFVSIGDYLADIESDDADYTSYGLLVTAGYYLSPNFFIDLSYVYTMIYDVDLRSNMTLDDVGGDEPDWRATGGKIRAIVEQPLNDTFSAYGGIGWATWDLDDGPFDDSWNAPLATAGILINYEQWKIRFGYEYQRPDSDSYFGNLEALTGDFSYIF